MFWRVLLGVIAVAIFAQIEIQLPLNRAGLGISGQTYAVVLIGYFLGYKEGTIAILCYLLAGFIGLPVFSGGTSGIDKLWGNSGGYLLGFVLAVAIIGKFVDRNKQLNVLSRFSIFLLGTFVILLFGTLRLTLDMDWSSSIQHGCTPFIAGGIIKCMLSTATTYLPNLWTTPR